VISGELDPFAAAREADQRCLGWRQADPERPLLYREWIEDVRSAEEARTG
jgi:hypothetical protein